MTPDLSDIDTRVLLALVHLHRPGRPVVYQGLVDATGIASKETIWKSLHRLRHQGLVAFEDRRQGTLRPLVRLVKP